MPATSVWRIARRLHALDRLGAGAREAGGRWNRPGIGVIYAGATVGIAALEAFVHPPASAPADLVLVRVRLPPGCSIEPAGVDDLPRGWCSVPPTPGSVAFGTAWALEKRSLVLKVPSALVPEEWNAVINPAHPQFPRVKMTIERAFSYDPRITHRRRAASEPW